MEAIQAITTLTTAQAQLLGLVFVRFATLLALFPVFRNTGVPPMWRAGMAFVLALIVFPTLPPLVLAAPSSVPGFLGMALREVLVGLVLGWTASLLFQVVEMAGHIIDAQIGYAIVELFDPQSGESTSIFGQLLVLVTTLAFIAAGGHLQLLSILAESFVRIPLMAARLDVDRIMPEVLGASAQAVLVSLQLAGPVLMALLLASVVLAVVSRVLPTFNVWMLSMPINILIAASVTSFTLPYFFLGFRTWQDHLFSRIYTLMRVMG